MISVAISLNKFDLKQCGEEEKKEAEDGESSIKQRDPFYGTDKCDRATTNVIYSFHFRTNSFNFDNKSNSGLVFQYRGKRLYA